MIQNRQKGLMVEMRFFLGLAMLINGICLLATIPVFSMASGAGELHITSKYRELDLAKVIDIRKDSSQDGYLFVEWIDIPEYLTNDAFSYVKSAALVFAFVNLVSFSCLLYVFLRGTWETKLPPAGRKRDQVQ